MNNEDDNTKLMEDAKSVFEAIDNQEIDNLKFEDLIDINIIKPGDKIALKINPKAFPQNVVMKLYEQASAFFGRDIFVYSGDRMQLQIIRKEDDEN